MSSLTDWLGVDEPIEDVTADVRKSRKQIAKTAKTIRTVAVWIGVAVVGALAWGAWRKS